MTTILAFGFVIGVLVLVHELGHFLAARRVGVRVLTFSVGFGPKIVKFRRGDTEYCISAIPLGGFVKMAGENPDGHHTGADDEFMSKSKWERFQILVMGPVMNFLLAIIVMTFVLYQGADRPAFEEEPPIVGAVTVGSAAEGEGIQIGDRIVSVEGQATDTWKELSLALGIRAGRGFSLVVRDHGGSTRTINVSSDSQNELASTGLGIQPIIQPQITSVTPGEPADLAGVESRDVIVALNGDPVTSAELVERINASADHSLDLTIRRRDTLKEIRVTPALVGDVGLIGVGLSAYEVTTIEPGFLEAFNLSLEQNYEWAGLIFQTVGGLLTGGVSVNQLAGPIGIAQVSGQAAGLGLVALFNLMALISVNLGVLNLLPIPVLDGGHILILALEGASGRDFSMQLKERMMMVGFALLMTLMVTVIYNDLMRIDWIERVVPWR